MVRSPVRQLISRAKRHNPAYSCAGKGRWRSEEAAQHALTLMRAEGRGTWGPGVRPYRCHNSGKKTHWHLGHE